MYKIGFVGLIMVLTISMNVTHAELVTGKCEDQSDLANILNEWKVRNLSRNGSEKSLGLTVEPSKRLYGALIYCGSNEGKLVYSYTFNETSPRRALEKCSRGLISLMNSKNVFSAPKIKLIDRDQVLFESL